MARRQWTCPKCGRVQVNTRSPICVGCGENTRPKLRVQKHVANKDALPWEEAAAISVEIHGGELGACAFCGRPAKLEGKRHHRDHDPKADRFRGIACHTCNRRVIRQTNLAIARDLVKYHARVEAYYLRKEMGRVR